MDRMINQVCENKSALVLFTYSLLYLFILPPQYSTKDGGDSIVHEIIDFLPSEIVVQ